MLRAMGAAREMLPLVSCIAHVSPNLHASVKSSLEESWSLCSVHPRSILLHLPGTLDVSSRFLAFGLGLPISSFFNSLFSH
ncbi:hypothetical protein GDO78_014760 [Eleutherodactylus coqui]|uniref:Uncharacterized protein n=1 Tax=Eleutherodactylus coqui TaxID=57060 RepID=A0A8J6B6C8_ELECQ|nr:hypothetical protein GDO78_014760 [Eleutherodactylus coqui]